MGLMRRQPCFFFYSVYITEVVLSALRNHHTTAINTEGYDDAAFLSEPALFLFKEQAYGRTRLTREQGMSNRRDYCCDHFKNHKRRIYLNLRVLSTKLIEEHPSLSLKCGDVVCCNCLTAITRTVDTRMNVLVLAT